MSSSTSEVSCFEQRQKEWLTEVKEGQSAV